jgi:hypothetical protein
MKRLQLGCKICATDSLGMSRQFETGVLGVLDTSMIAWCVCLIELSSGDLISLIDGPSSRELADCE